MSTIQLRTPAEKKAKNHVTLTWKFPSRKPCSSTQLGVDKTRNMEQPGTFRNIPEHEKIKFFFMEKELIN